MPCIDDETLMRREREDKEFVLFAENRIQELFDLLSLLYNFLKKYEIN